MTIRIVLTVRPGEDIYKALRDLDSLSWGSGSFERMRRGRTQSTLVWTHDTYSGRVTIYAGGPGVVNCLIEPTDFVDPERLLAVFVGLLHRTFQRQLVGVSISYVEPSRRARRPVNRVNRRPARRG